MHYSIDKTPGVWAALILLILLMWPMALHAAWASRSEVYVELGGGVREASLSWDIASDPTGTQTPNVLSALDWQNVTVLDVMAALEWRLPNHLFARIEGTLGNPVEGTMTDTDYSADHRSEELRRSTGAVSGERSMLGSFAAGRYWALNSRWQLQTALGVGVSTLELNNEQGYLHVDAENPADIGSIMGLDSDYNAYWSGVLARFGLVYEHPQWLFATYYSRYPQAHYDATARWNLRNDFAQPKSFDQEAVGVGEVWEWRIGREMMPAHWLLLVWRREAWYATKGDDRLYRPNQLPSLTRLNSVELDSTAWALQWQLRW